MDFSLTFKKIFWRLFLTYSILFMCLTLSFLPIPELIANAIIIIYFFLMIPAGLLELMQISGMSVENPVLLWALLFLSNITFVAFLSLLATMLILLVERVRLFRKILS